MNEYGGTSVGDIMSLVENDGRWREREAETGKKVVTGESFLPPVAGRILPRQKNKKIK
jgi:hypothetical protein